MTSSQIRAEFLKFFASKDHKIVPSAPLVNQDDPSLMFINAGMNPFKDYFLGLKTVTDPRVADTQKCLRVSGKHNDLDEVGRDGYHHTMFEMLGNWSFGDYFKKEAIAWAWEFLTEVLSINKEDLYITIFEGDPKDGIQLDQEAHDYWKQWVPEERILPFGKKDNFWEMGASGPCGPCSEIHIDLRSEADKKKVPASSLVNADHPEVIEIWNLVFIEFNRKDDGILESLPAKHIDTGMGFERLAMVMQSKLSSYDTDVFRPYILELEKISGHKYTASYDEKAMVDMTFRVIADHLRAIVFAISDGLLPSNTGPGYVIRRILRRAVRYYYSFFGIEEPIMYRLVPVMARYYDGVFDNITAQSEFIAAAIREEEKSFLRTLSSGIQRLQTLTSQKKELSGAEVFELYDTYGFPYDLTELITNEQGIQIDRKGFLQELENQKSRSRKDAGQAVADWIVLSPETQVQFLGYDQLELDQVKILRYRTIQGQKKQQFQVVLDRTPFYAESGGQIGDAGLLLSDEEQVKVIDTKKENDLIIHFTDRLPMNPKASFTASVYPARRQKICSNHSATHLLHSALREVLGTHVQQKGSLVADAAFRFDFSHFQKMTKEEILSVEQRVNAQIRANISKVEERNVPLAQAKDSGALMLFGEKYGEEVRIITFDPQYSKELCGGCHVERTGEIGLFKIKSESAIGAGVRRIEALTGAAAEAHVLERMETLDAVSALLKNADDPKSAVASLQEENKNLQKQLNAIAQSQAQGTYKSLVASAEMLGKHKAVVKEIELHDPKQAKNLLFQLNKNHLDTVAVIGVKNGPKVQLFVGMDKKYAQEHSLDAKAMIGQVASIIGGGGGGQAHFASAGGSKPDHLAEALDKIKEILAQS